MPSTLDDAEIAKFDALAARWWDPDGPMKPLHDMNPCRLDFIAAQIAAQFGRRRRGRRPFEGLSLLDVGCGAGLATEPMARLGLAATGLDGAKDAIAAARAHAEAVGLAIDYRAGTAEALAAAGAAFDVVLALEIVEHVADVPAFLEAVGRLTRPGGLVVLSTLNRTPESWATAILGAERILGWLPVGTHDWRRFPAPAELEAGLTEAGLVVVDAKGMVPDPFRDGWRLSDQNLRVNYILAAEKPDAAPRDGAVG